MWKGVEFDPMGMSGSSDLWREDDANCCPTGGRAYFDFAIEGTSLTLTDVNVRQSEAMIAPRP